MTKRRFFFALVPLLLLATCVAARADAAFDRWLTEQWPAAEKLGVSRATFDKAIAGLHPDLSLPDLAIPGRPEKAPQQPEFVQTPAQYLREATFQRLAARGKQLAAQYHDTLARISREFGVPGDVVDQIAAGTYRQWVASVTQKAFDSGIDHTPTLFVNGAEFTGNAFTVGPLTKAIEAAAG